MEKNWDVFISHATEDKNTIVRELADILEKLHVKIWYDDYSLRVGDSLSKSIDEGLINSRYGILIISKAFLEKQWTEYEYRSLLSKEENGKKIILPIWHNITKDEIKKYSLYLSDKIALDTTKISTTKIALKLTEIIRPDIYQSLKSYLLFKDILKKAKIKKTKSSDLKRQDKPQSKLSKQLEVRARNIYYGIGQLFDFSITESINLYELDLRPDREIQIWEIMNLCYLEIIDKYKITDNEEKKAIANLLLGFSIGQLLETNIISDERMKELWALWKKYIYEY